MDTDAEFDATLGRKTGVSLDHTVLHFDGAANSVDYAAELNQSSIAGALHDAPLVHGDGRINQIAPKRPKSRQCSIFVGAGQPAVADYIRRQNCRKFAGFGHNRSPPTQK
jgi:hypothetical protein